MEHEETPPVAQSEGEAPDATEENAQESDHSHGDLPDPAMLFSYVAMQMETPALVQALAAIFDGHAWRALGLISDPRTGTAQKDLPSAQLAIDLVAFCLSKTEASLSETERRDANRRLADLRMNYLAKLRES